MKRIFTIILVIMTIGAMAQNRVFDTISFLKGGNLYKILLWNDSLQLNGNKYYSNRSFSVDATAPLNLSFANNTLTGYMPCASAAQSGYLSAIDWSNFNSKENTPWINNVTYIGLVDETIPIFSYIKNDAGNQKNSTLQQTYNALQWTSSNSIYGNSVGISCINGNASKSGIISLETTIDSKLEYIKLMSQSGIGGALYGYSQWNANNKLNLGSSSSPWGVLYSADGNSTNWSKAYSLAKMDSVKWRSIDRYGFVNRDSVVVTYNETTHVVTLAAKSPQTKFRYFRDGRLFTIYSSKTYDLDDVQAGDVVDGDTYYVYITDTVGTLSAKNQTDPWTLLDDRIPVAVVNWNSTLYPKYWLSPETHQALIDRRMHAIEHLTEGTKMITTPLIADYVVDGTTNDDNTFSISEGIVADEDLIHTIASLTDPAGTTGEGAYVVFYHTGSGTWAWDTTDLPYKFTAGGYVQYDNGSTTIQASQPRYLNSYLILTNKQGAARHVIVMGRNEFSTAADAYGESPATFDWTGFPIQESVLVYQMTWKTSASLGTRGKCQLARIPQRITSSIATAITQVNTVATAAPITGNGSSGAPVAITQSSTSSSGYLSSTDWNTFNNKKSSQWEDNGTGIQFNDTITMEFVGGTNSAIHFLGGTDVDVGIKFTSDWGGYETTVGLQSENNQFEVVSQTGIALNSSPDGGGGRFSLIVDGDEKIEVNEESGIEAKDKINAYKTVDYFVTLSGDSTCNGTRISLQASTSMVVGDVIYIDANGKAARCNASTITNCPYALGICTKYVAANGSGYYMTSGKIRNDGWNWTTGGLIYVATGGVRGSTLTQTAPSSSNNVIMPVGVALGTTTIYFFGNLNSVEKL